MTIWVHCDTNHTISSYVLSLKCSGCKTRYRFKYHGLARSMPRCTVIASSTITPIMIVEVHDVMNLLPPRKVKESTNDASTASFHQTGWSRIVDPIKRYRLGGENEVTVLLTGVTRRDGQIAPLRDVRTARQSINLAFLWQFSTVHWRKPVTSNCRSSPTDMTSNWKKVELFLDNIQLFVRKERAWRGSNGRLSIQNKIMRLWQAVMPDTAFVKYIPLL